MRGYHSKSDNDILNRSNLIYSYENLSKNGIILKKLPYTPKGSRRLRKPNLNYDKTKINLDDLKKYTFPIDSLKFQENSNSKYETFSKFNFYKNYISNKNYKLKFKSLINSLSFNNSKNTSDNLNIICILNELIKKMSFLSYLEIGSKNTFRVNAISRENQNISIFNAINSKGFDLGLEEWIKQIQVFNDVHKCYLKILPNQYQHIETLLNEMPIENFSSLATIEEPSEYPENILQLLIKKKNLFGMFFINNKNSKFISEFENKLHFKKIISLDSYNIYLNDNFLSKKMSKELNLFFIQKNKLSFFKEYIYNFLYFFLRLKILKFNLKKNFRRKFKK